MADFEKVFSLKLDMTKAIDGFKRLDALSGSLNKELKKLNRTSKVTNERFETLGKHLTFSVKNVKSLNANLSRTKRKMNEAGKAGARSFRQVEKSTKKTKKLISGIGIGYKTAGVAALGFAVGTIRSNVKLNESMANVQTLLSGGTEQAFALKKEIQDMSISSGKSTEDLADGLYEVISAFGESSENVKQLGVAVKAGIGGRSTTLEAVKLLSAVTKGYGDTSEEAQKKAANLAFQTVKLGQTTFPELAASIGRVTPLSAALNVSQEDMFATMAALTGVNGTAAEVTTQLASVYSAFLKPSKELTKITKKYGFETAAQMIKNKGLAGTLEVLKNETGGNIDAISKLVTRKEGQLALTSLLNDQYDVYNDKLKQLKGNATAADDAFRAQTEGINAQGQAWKQTSAEISVLSQNIGQSLLPLLKNALTSIKWVTDGLNNITAMRADASIESSFSARTRTAKIGTAEEKQAALNKLLATREDTRKKSITGEDVGVLESLSYMVSGGISPMEKRKMALAEQDRAITSLQESLSKDYNKNYLSGSANAYNMTLAGNKPGSQTNNINATINVNGVSDPMSAAKFVKRELDKEIKRGTQTVGAGER